MERGKMKRRKDCCPVCHQHYIQGSKTRYRSPHHILPRRWFGKHGEVCYLCRGCHNDLEKIIEKVEKAFGGGRLYRLTEDVYYSIYRAFVYGK